MRFGVMDTLELLLTILCGILITWIIVKQKPLLWRMLSTRDEAAVGSAHTIVSTKTPTTTSAKKPFVVRVRGIQAKDASQAETLVRDTIGRLADEKDCIGDITIVPSCTDTDMLVALVDFKFLPDFFSSLKSSKEPFQVLVEDSYYLAFDAKFLGFTQTYPTEAKPTAE